MTRFNISLKEAIKLVETAIQRVNKEKYLSQN